MSRTSHRKRPSSWRPFCYCDTTLGWAAVDVWMDGGQNGPPGSARSDERNRWKRKRIMLRNQAVYFPAWNGEHKKRCWDAFRVGGIVWLCHHRCLILKVKMHFLKALLFLIGFPQNSPDFSSSRLMQQTTIHTYSNICLQCSRGHSSP